MEGVCFSVTGVDMDSKYTKLMTFYAGLESSMSQDIVLFSVSSSFSFFLKKLCSRGKQFFLFSDPWGEVGNHPGFPSAS